MDFASLATQEAKAAKTGQDGKELLRSYLYSQTTLQSYGID